MNISHSLPTMCQYICIVIFFVSYLVAMVAIENYVYQYYCISVYLIVE